MSNEEYQNRLRVAIDFLMELELYEEVSMLRARLDRLSYLDRVAQPEYVLSGVGLYGLDQVVDGLDEWVDDRLMENGLVVFDSYMHYQVHKAKLEDK